MGYTIQHLAGPTNHRSYSVTGEAVDLAWQYADQSQRADIRPLWNFVTGRNAGDGATSFRARTAAGIAWGLSGIRWPLTARASRTNRELIALIGQIATAANVAARSGRDWHWT